jgi:hypothetical protein
MCTLTSRWNGSLTVEFVEALAAVDASQPGRVEGIAKIRGADFFEGPWPGDGLFSASPSSISLQDQQAFALILAQDTARNGGDRKSLRVRLWRVCNTLNKLTMP